jgi:hypothetical protein
MTRSKQASARGKAATRRIRAVLAAFGFLAIVVVVWSFSSLSSTPAWFNAVLLGLTAINLLAWVLEPLGQERSLPCKGCGQMRPHRTRKCVSCGASGFKVPLVNWIALALISAFFAGGGIAMIWAYALDKEAHGDGRLVAIGVALILFSGMVVATACDVKFAKKIRTALGELFPYDIDDDIDRLRKHRPTAARAILLIVSIVALVVATLVTIRLS